MKIKIFSELQEVYDCYGEENIVPITNLAQIIYYTSKWRVQPKYVCESDRNQGRIVCYFHKGETKKPYEEWMNNRKEKEN